MNESADRSQPSRAREEQGDSVKFDRLRTLLAMVLTQAADLSDRPDFTKLAANVKVIEQATPKLPYKRWRKIYVALGFWSCWIAEASQGFPANALVSRHDWPRLARLLAEDLQHNRDITEPQIRAIADLSGTYGTLRYE